MSNDKLISYAVIVAAKHGDAVAMQKILQHYDGFINRYSRKEFYDEFGNCYTAIDQDIKGRIQAKLMYQIIFNFDLGQLPEDTQSE